MSLSWYGFLWKGCEGCDWSEMEWERVEIQFCVVLGTWSAFVSATREKDTVGVDGDVLASSAHLEGRPLGQLVPLQALRRDRDIVVLFQNKDVVCHSDLDRCVSLLVGVSRVS